MKYFILVIAIVILGAGCASSRLELRLAQVERELAAAKRPATARAITPAEAVAMGDMAAAVNVGMFVMFVDEQPRHCNGALCWRIENGHDQPILIQVNGQQVQGVGPNGPFLPPHSTGWIRLTAPTTVVVTYSGYDTIPMEGADQEMPLPTALYRCRTPQFKVGTFADAEWGGKTTNLDASFCL